MSVPEAPGRTRQRRISYHIEDGPGELTVEPVRLLSRVD